MSNWGCIIPNSIYKTSAVELQLPLFQLSVTPTYKLLLWALCPGTKPLLVKSPTKHMLALHIYQIRMTHCIISPADLLNCILKTLHRQDS